MPQQFVLSNAAPPLRLGETTDVQAVSTKQQKVRKTIRAGETTPVLPIAGLAVSVIGFYNVVLLLGQMAQRLSDAAPPVWLTTLAGAGANLFGDLWVANCDPTTLTQAATNAGQDAVRWTLWLAGWAIVAACASYLPTRIARWGMGLGNLLFFVGMTTEYSLTVSPIWVLSASQINGWAHAVAVAITVTVAQSIVAAHVARRRSKKV